MKVKPRRLKNLRYGSKNTIAEKIPLNITILLCMILYRWSVN